MKKNFLLFICLLVFACTWAQSNKKLDATWRVVVERKDGKQVPFQLEQREEDGKTILYVINAAEKIRITNVAKNGDSLFFSIPPFESSFRIKMLTNGDISGTYIKGTARATQYWRLYGYANNRHRFNAGKSDAKNDISGRWDMTITRTNGTLRKAVGIFEQKGNKLTGSVLTPSADNRYLDGIVTGDSLMLSGFDGDNIHLYEAKIDNDHSISGGVFYNGYSGRETWIAVKNDSVALPGAVASTHLRKGYTKLNFTFNDLQGQPVSINDKKYKNKVVVVQILGTWCANCLDETKFLVDYYNHNRPKDVEIIALAYELTTDLNRSKKSLARFQKLLHVPYPILITGVAAGDDQKTEKTLPRLTPIRSFPTSIFIDKKGNVRDIHTNFYGPATGKYYIESKNEFYQTVDGLRKE